MEVLLPMRFTRHTMYRLLNKVITEDYKPRYKDVTFDFTNLNFIEPVGVTILSNIFEWLMNHGVEVSINTNSPKNSRNCPIKYLDDSGFFELYLGESFQESAKTRGTTYPLDLVSYEKSYQWVRMKFIPWLAGKLGVTIESIDDIRICVEEIFNNINDHADTENSIGCIFAQHYPKWDEVKIAISDFGVGIPNNIRTKFPSLDDGEALFKAIQYKVSTQSTPKNRGVGLHHLITNVVENYKGNVHIYSYHGILSCKNGNNEHNITHSLKESSYPGTLLEIVFKTDAVENIIIEEEDLDW